VKAIGIHSNRTTPDNIYSNIYVTRLYPSGDRSNDVHGYIVHCQCRKVGIPSNVKETVAIENSWGFVDIAQDMYAQSEGSKMQGGGTRAGFRLMVCPKNDFTCILDRFTDFAPRTRRP
jgi:hypothetical protein